MTSATQSQKNNCFAKPSMANPAWIAHFCEPVMAASRRMWIDNVAPEIAMRLAGFKELIVEDDMKTIKLVFADKVMVLTAQVEHMQDDIEAQTRLAIMVDALCRSYMS